MGCSQTFVLPHSVIPSMIEHPKGFVKNLLYSHPHKSEFNFDNRSIRYFPATHRSDSSILLWFDKAPYLMRKAEAGMSPGTIKDSLMIERRNVRRLSDFVRDEIHFLEDFYAGSVEQPRTDPSKPREEFDSMYSFLTINLDDSMNIESDPQYFVKSSVKRIREKYAHPNTRSDLRYTDGSIQNPVGSSSAIYSFTGGNMFHISRDSADLAYLLKNYPKIYERSLNQLRLENTVLGMSA